MNDDVVAQVPPQCNVLGENGSRGLFAGDNPLTHPLPSLLLQLSLISLITRLMQLLLKPLAQPLIVSQILGGVVLGPSFFGRNGTILTKVFPAKGGGVIDVLSIFGFMVFIFLVGVKINPMMVLKSSRKALAVGILGYFVPLVLASFTVYLLEKFVSLEEEIASILPQVVVMQSMTSFPVIACFLDELKILNSEIGHLVSSSSIICDICHWSLIGLSYTAALAEDHSFLVTLGSIFSAALFVFFLAFVVRPAALWVTRNTPEEKPVKEIYIFMVLVAVMICGFTGEVIGLGGILACFLLGLAIPDGPPLGAAVVERFDFCVSIMLMPLFFTICGLEMDVFSVKKLKNVGVLQAVVLAAFIGKIIGTTLPLLLYRMPFRDIFSLALIMNSKGIVELALLHEYKHSKIMTEECYAILIISVVVITGVISPVVKLLYDPSRRYIAYKRRTIMHSSHNDELRVLACIHGQENVQGIFTLLQVSNPTKESRINLVVLHLVKLVGQASSLLVPHRPREDPSPNPTQSEQIFNAFKQFEEQNGEVLNVNCYKGVSPYETMHNDVCSLALEKRTILIVLPFHKKWSFGRTQTSNPFRLLNNNVLESAPCSVGILVDRGNMIRYLPPVYRVAMLFFGGADDREALAFALRMSGHPNVTLTVVRFTTTTGEIVGGSERSKILDDEILFQVSYEERRVNNTSEVVGVISSMGDSYELIVVGRRHKDSEIMLELRKWSDEVEEVGAVGGILASSEFKGESSVLVVQQQKRVWGLRDPEDSTHLMTTSS